MRLNRQIESQLRTLPLFRAEIWLSVLLILPSKSQIERFPCILIDIGTLIRWLGDHSKDMTTSRATLSSSKETDLIPTCILLAVKKSVLFPALYLYIYIYGETAIVMIKIALAGTSGVAQYIAHVLSTQTYHQFFFLSRNV
jgi:hypothetical protein